MADLNGNAFFFYMGGAFSLTEPGIFFRSCGVRRDRAGDISWGGRQERGGAETGGVRHESINLR